MSTHTAVGINDDLSSGQTAVALRATDYKASGWVDKDLGIFSHQFFWNDNIDNVFLDICTNLFHLNIWGVLVGDNDGFYCNWNIVFIFDGNLSFAVWTQIRQSTVLANFSQTFGKFVCQRNWHWHQLWCIIACKTEHHALVASTVVFFIAFGLFCFQTLVNAHCDISGLFIDRGDNTTGIAVKAKFCAVVTDLADYLTSDFWNVYITVSADLTHYHYHTGGNCGFACNTAVWIFFEDCIKHCVRNLVADFIRMSFSNRFRSK